MQVELTRLLAALAAVMMVGVGEASAQDAAAPAPAPAPAPAADDDDADADSGPPPPAAPAFDAAVVGRAVHVAIAAVAMSLEELRGAQAQQVAQAKAVATRVAADLKSDCAAWPDDNVRQACHGHTTDVAEGEVASAAWIGFAKASVEALSGVDTARAERDLTFAAGLRAKAEQAKTACKDDEDAWSVKTAALSTALLAYDGSKLLEAQLPATGYDDLACAKVDTNSNTDDDAKKKEPHPAWDEKKASAAWENKVEACECSTTLCLFAGDGRLLTEREETPEVARGDTIVVKVWGCKDYDGGKLSAKGIKSSNAFLRPTTSSEPEQRSNGIASAEAECSAYEILEEEEFEVGDDARLKAFKVTHQPHASNKKGSKSYRFEVDRALYFADVGLMMPFTLFGSNEVTEEPGTGGASVYRLRPNHFVAPAIALHIYPLGMPAGAFSPLWTLVDRDEVDLGLLCDFLRLGSLQFALDAEVFPNAALRLYGGIALNLLAGVSLSVGINLLQLEYLPEGIQSGQLVPEVRPTFPKLWSPRVYVGLTINTEVVNAAKALIGN